MTTIPILNRSHMQLEEFARRLIRHPDGSLTFNDATIDAAHAARTAHEIRHEHNYRTTITHEELRPTLTGEVLFNSAVPGWPVVMGDRYRLADTFDGHASTPTLEVCPDGCSVVTMNRWEPRYLVEVETNELLEALEEADATFAPQRVLNRGANKDTIEQLIVTNNYIICVDDPDNGALYPRAVNRRDTDIRFIRHALNSFDKEN